MQTEEEMLQGVLKDGIHREEWTVCSYEAQAELGSRQTVWVDLLVVKGKLSARAETVHLPGQQAWVKKVVGNMLNRNREQKV